MSTRLAVPVLVCCAAAASASVVESLDLPSLTAMSERVVRARVTKSESAWDGTRIYTKHTLSVVETLAGARASDELVLFQWGGIVGDIGQHVVGEAEVREGLDAVFFLEPGVTAGTWRSVGLAQGVWPVFDNGRGNVSVGRSASPLTVRMRGAKGTTVMMPDRGASPVAYSTFRMDVRRFTRRTR